MEGEGNRYKIPEFVKELSEEAKPPLPNISLLAQANGLPTNQGELKSIIIDKFGLSKFELQSYLQGVSFVKSKLGEKSNEAKYNGKIGQVTQQDQPLIYSALNTPIWDYLLIEGDTYQDKILGTITYPDIQLETILMTISQSHKLVLTEIQGRDNEVIEYVGKASFRINFKGGVYSNNNNRPKTAISDVKKMLNSNKPLKIKYSGFLGEWDISEIYVLDKSIPQTMGGYNYQLFEFNAIQNVPVILASKQTQ